MFKTLLVEDNLIYRATLKKVLQARFPQLEIKEASDKDQAMLITDAFDPDLIFMDINLPRCNGLELTRTIKSTHTQAVVIILSSYDLPEYRNVYQQFGADYFMPKQTSLESVFKLVEGIISDSHLH